MKKLFSLFLLSSSMTFLHGYYNEGTCPAAQGYSYDMNYQNPQYQGQYNAPQYQGSQYQGGQYYTPQYQGQYNAPRYQGSQYQSSQYQGYQYQQDQNANGDYQRHFYQQDNNGSQYQKSDVQLAKEIKDSLQSPFSNKYTNVTVNVNNGYVTLTGTVPTKEDKTALEREVSDMDGVAGVNNQVTVQKQQGSNYMQNNGNNYRNNGGRYGQ